MSHDNKILVFKILITVILHFLVLKEPFLHEAFRSFKNPSCSVYPVQGVQGGWSLCQLGVQRWSTPWTGLQSVTGLAQGDGQRFKLTSTPMGNLESSIKVTWIGLSLTCVKKNPTLVPRECWPIEKEKKKNPIKQLSDVLSVTLGLCVTDSGLALLRLVFNIDYHIMFTQYVFLPAGSPSQ